MNKTQEFIQKAKIRLHQKIDSDVLIKYLLEEISQQSYSKAIMEDYLVKNPDKIEHIETSINRLLTDEPIQYILGYTYFYGMKLKVNPETLIPRPETEELVDIIVKENQNPNKILDLCSGSGCIAISLAKAFPLCKVLGMEISSGAISVSQENAILNKISNVDFKQKNVFNDFEVESDLYDIIVSNPPYVTRKEIANMSESVLNFEPHSALFVQDENPLSFYKRILEILPTLLKKTGKLYTEINPDYAQDLMGLTQGTPFTSSIINDLTGKKRFWVVQFEN